MGVPVLINAPYHKPRRGKDDRYTPPWLLARVEAFLGSGWFDPCPASYETAPTANGLALPWHGRVYCNPPYSRLAPWITKFRTEQFREGLLLVPIFTDVQWFQPLFAYPILFFRGRISFMRADGTIKGPAPFGCALVYRGRRKAAFAKAFGDLGTIVVPMRQANAPATLWAS